MGLDIYLRADNMDQLYSIIDNDDNKYSVSRTFCNFMCRRNVIEGHEAELDQLGNITGIDILPIYDMENYIEDEELEGYLENCETEKEKEQIKASAENDREKLKGNINTVLNTVSLLIEKLSTVTSIPSLLIKTDYDTLNNKVYFSDFNSDKGDGYIGNNFGRDLRNFQNFLVLAKQNGASTVWFMYG